MKRFTLTGIMLYAVQLFGQVPTNNVTDTTASSFHKVIVEGYIDTYYAYDFNKPATGARPYFVSMAQHNEASINLAYVDVRYTSPRLRGRIVPGFGTYVNANYADEPGSLKNIIEASAGLRLIPGKNMWIDAGVFTSPYTNESAISRDHLAYSRSFAPEYVPYYLAGVKFTAPIKEKFMFYLYLLNGWQQISDNNEQKSIGTQVEYRPNRRWLINWGTYTGNEWSEKRPDFGMRYFTDLYFIYNGQRLSATGCIYYGVQERAGGSSSWWQANIVGRYNVTPKVSVTGRLEYFDDQGSVQIMPVTSVSGFNTYSSSMGLNFKFAENVLVRFEGRTFFSGKEVYLERGTPSGNSNMIISNVTMWFR